MAAVAITMWGLAALAMFLTALGAIGLLGSAVIVGKLMDSVGYVGRQ